jgi:hypothetical protein
MPQSRMPSRHSWSGDGVDGVAYVTACKQRIADTTAGPRMNGLMS